MTESAEIDALAEHFGKAPAVFNTSPLYQALCPVVASDRELLEQLTQRRPGQQPSYLLFGAVHQLLLSGAEHRLREFYPSLADDAAVDPAQAGPAFSTSAGTTVRRWPGSSPPGSSSPTSCGGRSRCATRYGPSDNGATARSTSSRSAPAPGC